MHTCMEDKFPCLDWHQIYLIDKPAVLSALVSILGASCGFPGTTLRGSLQNFKGLSLTKYSGCAELYCFGHMAPLLPLQLSYGFSLVLSDSAAFSCTLSGSFAHYGCNKFLQRPFFVVFHVSITLVVGSLPTLPTL